MNACACGCGVATKPGKTFLRGHWARANRELMRSWQMTGRPSDHGDGYFTELVGIGERRLSHVLIAEKALGKRLPAGAVVHHLNGIRSDNRKENLAIFPDGAYHAMIHRRMRAMEASGNANFRKCVCCKGYDDPEVMGKMRRPNGDHAYYHRSCWSAYVSKLYRQKKERQTA